MTTAGDDRHPVRGNATRSTLVRELRSRVDLTDSEARVVVNAVLGGISGAVKRGETVALRGFGAFRSRHRAARVARNPGTGERVEVPARRVPVFRPAKRLRQSVADRRSDS